MRKCKLNKNGYIYKHCSLRENKDEFINLYNYDEVILDESISDNERDFLKLRGADESGYIIGNGISNLFTTENFKYIEIELYNTGKKLYESEIEEIIEDDKDDEKSDDVKRINYIKPNEIEDNENLFKMRKEIYDSLVGSLVGIDSFGKAQRPTRDYTMHISENRQQVNKRNKKGDIVMEQKIFLVTHEMKLSKVKYKNEWSWHPPFKKIYTYCVEDSKVFYSYTVSDTIENAIKNTKETVVFKKVGDFCSIETSYKNYEDFVVDKIIIKAKEQKNMNIDFLKKNLVAKDFIKYCTYYNMQYKDLF